MNKQIFFGATDRNKEPILEVLKKIVSSKFGSERPVTVLEIASGTGQHAVHFSRELKHIEWQPSDINKQYIESIKAFKEESQLLNLQQPIHLDICSFRESSAFGKKFNLMVAINLLHISPWKCSVELFRAATEFLTHDGILLLYGPFSIHGSIAPDSNVRFNEHLKSQNPAWGLRDVDDLVREAERCGIVFDAMFDMPANNKILIWTKKQK